MEVYEVGSTSSDTILTLTSDFVRDTVSAVDYVYFEDEYFLDARFLRPIDQQKFDDAQSIDLMGRTEFRRRYPSNRLPGKLRVATMVEGPDTQATNSISAAADAGSGLVVFVTTSTTGLSDGETVTITGTTSYNGTFEANNVFSTLFSIVATFVASETGTWTRNKVRKRRIRFHPPPDTATMIPYTYVTKQLAVSAVGNEQESLNSDTDEPIVPVRYRHAIVYHALANWYRDKKDDVRAQSAAADYASLMNRVVSDNEIGDNRAQIRPRNHTYKSRAKRPWRGGGARFDINGEFDRLER